MISLALFVGLNSCSAYEWYIQVKFLPKRKVFIHGRIGEIVHYHNTFLDLNSFKTGIIFYAPYASISTALSIALIVLTVNEQSLNDWLIYHFIDLEATFQYILYLGI